MASPTNQSDAVLSVTDLQLSFGSDPILDGATLAVNEGEKVGLVGRNGCGKSSFLRIVAGEEKADSGTISRRQGLVGGYLPQEFQLDENATVEENIRAGASDLIHKIERYENAGELSPAEMDRLLSEIEHADGWNLETRIETLMRELAAPPADRVVSYLSGGEKRRVGLCRALIAQPELIILDEPTNHLDAKAIAWLEGFLVTMPGACLFVTHDRYFLDRIATRIVELDGGCFFSYRGNYSDYLAGKVERQEREQASEKRRQSFLRREVSWVKAGVKARGTKQRSRLDNYYAVKAQKAPDQELDMELVIPTPPRLANVVVDLKEVGHYWDGDPLFLGVDLEMKAGECVGIVGPNGTGKTTLLQIILGKLQPAAGNVTIGKRTEFNYVDQTRLELDEDNSVLDEVSQGVDYVQFGEEKISVRAYLQRFLFGNDRINDRIGNLSGGEKNRVLLAKILKRGGNFLVLDEPTNDLDLQSLRVLEEALINFSGTSVVVSHDRWFLDRICDRVIVFEGGGQVATQEGNYSYYLEKRRNLDAIASASRVKSAKKKRVRNDDGKPRKLKWKEESELEGMEDNILAAESEIEEIEAQLNDPSFYIENSEKAVEMSKDLEQKKEAIRLLYERWEELEAIRLAWESEKGG
ncbi:ABC-F family ATP-binding cassette domain-containing protein [Verrucomicrobiales bacterium]|nr:ABC-F family ATP-binding cassette domain-containing protein [Verrucomicrobiales bacterium]MDB3939933.1 ABC-F family ATP-binding cassette domain-containing protein [Verrucomicrobiales bacterium]